MPIVGLTDRPPMMPRLGKIHLGKMVKHENGNEYPRATPHFVFETDHAEELRRQRAQQLVAIYGEAPTELPIVLPADSEDIVADTNYKAYGATRSLVCKGDGITARRLVDPSDLVSDNDGRPYAPIAGPNAQNTQWVSGLRCPGEECEYYGRTKGAGCNRMMNLQVMLPDAPGVGTYQIDSTSLHSILNIYSGMTLVRSLFGRVSGIPLSLSLEPREVAPDGRRKTVHVLHLRSTQTLRQVAASAERHVKMLEAGVPQAPSDEPSDLLYPPNGFAPDNVNARAGEIVDGSTAPLRTGHHHVEPAPPPARPSRWAQIQAEVEAEGIVAWPDFGPLVLNLSGREFDTYCRKNNLDVYDQAMLIYDSYKAELTLNTDGETASGEWVDDSDPVAAMAEVVEHDDGKVDAATWTARYREVYDNEEPGEEKAGRLADIIAGAAAQNCVFNEGGLFFTQELPS